MSSVDILDNAKVLFFVGIGGSGMRGMAKLFHSRGFDVAGIDDRYEEVRDSGELGEIQLYHSSEAVSVLDKVDAVIVSDAIAKDHEVLAAVKDKGIDVIRYCEALGWISNKYHTIAVAGTHGKSSTTAMLGHILAKTGADPTVLCGAKVAGWQEGNVRFGSGRYFVVEADEYLGHFLDLSIRDLVITSIDFDHPDYFKSAEDYAGLFIKLVQKLPQEGRLVVPAALNVDLKKAGMTQVAQAASVELAIPGEHMKMNAALAVQMAEMLDVNKEEAEDALKSFNGLERRFELLGKVGGMDVISDYGHHPAEIRATLQAARDRYGDKQIVVIFEAHTYGRLNEFWQDYITALSKADGVIVVPVYRARGEALTNRRTGEELAGALAEAGIKAQYAGSFEGLQDIIMASASEHDVALAFTAGQLDAQLRKMKYQAG